MKTEDAKLDQIVWQCHTTSTSDDATLRKGIIAKGVCGGAVVKTLGVYVKGEFQHLGQKDDYLTGWHLSIKEAANHQHKFFDTEATTNHRKLNVLLASIGDLT